MFQIFQGNTDVSSVVRHDLNPAIVVRYIRIHPGYEQGDQTCMRLELYGCLFKKVIVSYSMPVGQKTKNGKVDYKDTTYTGVIINDLYKNGTGILTDRKFGPVDAKQFRGKGWVGWNNTIREYIDIVFEFSDVRKFKDATLTVNVDKRCSHAVFNKSQIFFASTKDGFSGTSFLRYCPKGDEAQDYGYNANLTLPLCENTARFIKLRLYFGGIWLLITEISFNSDPAIGKVNSSLQSCSEQGCVVTETPTTSSQLPVETTAKCEDCTPSSTKTPAAKPSSSKLPIIIIILCVVLLIVILLLVVIFLLYRKRLLCFGKMKQKQKPEKNIHVELQNIDDTQESTQSPSEPIVEPSQNNQVDYQVPTTDDETAPVPYEEVPFSPPTYTDLDVNKRNRQRITDDNTYQKLLKPDIEYAYPTLPETAPYEYVQNSPATVYTELNTNQQHQTTDNDAYQKLLKYDPNYAIPGDGDDEPEPYEEVRQEKTPPGYSELDTSQRHQITNDDAYQKLLKCDPDYVIPADGDA